ncbi:MAG TPA: flagellin [Phenylobacterium sp.]|uniref:flagellin n=1 Tax=Phenylobacterium sp. TaxID=1871053 RepID=UPI002B4917A4|nr:flagellin [Phenylobacterium sp.]HKR88442.1 flagellin [Phenylobacterium sp.]
MNRVSTAGNYALVLANLTKAQQSQMYFGNQVATQKKGSDLKAYSATADTLTAMHTVQARLKSYQDQNTVVADRLSSQDVALNQVTDAAGNIRQALANALATGSSETMMTDIEAQVSSAVEGMNARYNGKYLFAGGQVDTKPVSLNALADLTDPPPPAAPVDTSSFFHNDDYKMQNKIDDSTSVTSGVLASDVGSKLLDALHTLQNSPVGPFNGPLTPAQQTWIQQQLAGWDSIRSDLTTQTAANGLNQKRLDTSKDNVTAQDTTVTGMIGDVTDADMGQAATQLQMAQMAVQAAAHVFQTLQGASLLSILPAG